MIASRFFAVGAFSVHSQRGVGILATQALMNPLYGPAGLILLAQGPAAAAVVLDQEQPVFVAPPERGFLAIGSEVQQKLAQTVTAGRSGWVVRIDLPVGCVGSGDLVLTLTDVTAAGLPGDRALGTTRVPAADLYPTEPSSFREIPLAAPIALRAGERFAITLDVGTSLANRTGSWRSVRPEYVDRLYGATPGAVIDEINGVESEFGADVSTVLLIGHEPAMSATALGLSDGRNIAVTQELSLKFPTSAIAVLQTASPWRELSLGGAELARAEIYHEGVVPLHTLRAEIDYGFAEASTVYGKIGVKCWICRGEVKPKEKDRSREQRERVERSAPSAGRSSGGPRIRAGRPSRAAG